MRSLRARIAVAVATVVVAGMVAVAVVSVLALRSYLVGRADSELVGTRDRVSAVLDTRGEALVPEQLVRGSVRAGLGASVVHLRAGGRTVASYAADGPTSSAPTDAEVTALLRGPGWVPSAGAGHRGIAVETPGLQVARTDGQTLTVDQVVIVLDVSDDLATVRRLAFIELVAGGTAALGASAATWWLVGRGLSPLRRMARDARQAVDGHQPLELRAADAPTETRALAQAIDQALADRARAERRLRDFVADAAHELRTPLTSVHGWADLYQQGALTGPEVDRAFERIGAQTSRMRHLVDQLALLARLDADVPLARTTVDLRALVDDVVDDLAVLAPDRPVTWHRPDSPVLVDGDAARLAQVVQNLVGNVLRHTPGTAALRLDLAVDGASAELVVADDGPGIPADLVPHVLDRFVRRSRPDRPDEAEGSGLGLAIVDGLVRAHHGTLTLDSAPDAGTTVQVRLPLRAPGA